MSKDFLIGELQDLVNLIQNSKDFGEKMILVEAHDSYREILVFIKDDNLKKAVSTYAKVRTFPRAYLEVYSDWDNPLLSEIGEINQFIENYFSEIKN